MKFIKNNIKLIIFIIVFIGIFALFNIFFNRPVDYTIEYDYSDFHVVESFVTKDEMYTFKVSNDNHTYEFAFNHKYNKFRKILNKLDSFDNNDYLCLSIGTKFAESSIICNKDNDYYDYKLNNNTEDISGNDFTIVNNDNEYYIWNGYGITNKNTNNEYKFLSNESYTNNLYYQYKDYIIFADYDQKREFNKFYIFDNKKKTIHEWKINYTISFDSYFLGYYYDDLYLYDVTNETEYRLNIDKKKIKTVSKNGMVYYYDGEFKKINKNILIYNITPFKYNNIINYTLLDDKLYYTYYGSDVRIRITDKKVKDIIYTDINNKVYYISDDKLYSFDNNNGEQLLAKYFEWNFDYKDKIYVF
jgi:hypothetical protein